MSDDRLSEIDPAEINSIPIGVDADGTEVVARVGRFGPYLRRGDATRPLPDDLAPDELTIERALELLAEPTERILGTDPETGLDIIVRPGPIRPVRLGRAARRNRRTPPHCVAAHGDGARIGEP